MYKRGTQTANGITDLTYRMDRHYDPVGNIELLTVDRNGDEVYTGAGERIETRLFDDTNQITSRTLTNNSIVTPTWSAAGELVQDGQARTRIFDAWGNLVKVEKTLGGQTLLELRRDGLNRVIMQHGKPNGGSGIVNSSDPVLYYLPDSQGRPLAVFEAGKVHPTLERQIPGPQSLVGCRESRDDDSDGVRDRETFVLPDATGSAAGFFDNSTGQMERVHYDPMGVPTCFPSGDINADGKTDWDDYVLLRDDIESSQYDDKGDTDADGDVDVWDAAGFDPKFAGEGILSLTGNTLGLHQMPRTDQSYLAIARTYSEELGRWMSRDPLGFVDGPSVYQAMRGNVFAFSDKAGLQAGLLLKPKLSDHDLRPWVPGKGLNGFPGEHGKPSRLRFQGRGFAITTTSESKDGRSYVSPIMSEQPPKRDVGSVTGCANPVCNPCIFAFTIYININGLNEGDNDLPPDINPFYRDWHGVYGHEEPIEWDYFGESDDVRITPDDAGHSPSDLLSEIVGVVPCGESRLIVVQMSSWRSPHRFSELQIELECSVCVHAPKRKKDAGGRGGPSTPGGRVTPGGGPGQHPGPNGGGSPSTGGGPGTPGPGGTGDDKKVGPITPGSGGPGTPGPSGPRTGSLLTDLVVNAVMNAFQ